MDSPPGTAVNVNVPAHLRGSFENTVVRADPSRAAVSSEFVGTGYRSLLLDVDDDYQSDRGLDREVVPRESELLLSKIMTYVLFSPRKGKSVTVDVCNDPHLEGLWGDVSLVGRGHDYGLS